MLMAAVDARGGLFPVGLTEMNLDTGRSSESRNSTSEDISDVGWGKKFLGSEQATRSKRPI